MMRPRTIDDLTRMLDQFATDADELTDADEDQQNKIRSVLNDAVSIIQKLQ